MFFLIGFVIGSAVDVAVRAIAESALVLAGSGIAAAILPVFEFAIPAAAVFAAVLVLIIASALGWKIAGRKA